MALFLVVSLRGGYGCKTCLQRADENVLQLFLLETESLVKGVRYGAFRRAATPEPAEAPGSGPVRGLECQAFAQSLPLLYSETVSPAISVPKPLSRWKVRMTLYSIQ
jgi:hypothetical protein